MEKPKNSYRLEKFNKVNEQFFNYYRLQEIIPPNEWDMFIQTLREDLPSSFRIQNCLPEKETLIQYLEEKYFAPLRDLNDESIHAPESIPFVENAFQTNMSRSTVRSHPILRDLHEFLINENTIGTMSRQEAVSMVPPLLLDIQPQHLILDACASPGSKTMQIIELMHKKSSHPDGLLIANDVDYNRCYLLVHQTLKRMPTANCVVVNTDASQFPSVLGPDSKPMFFDRVLCDVICSECFFVNGSLRAVMVPKIEVGFGTSEPNFDRPEPTQIHPGTIGLDRA
uniref:SAM-dependent MTase RsmB/NOP-type domain-containing protein n=1 Tax=Acrobeloides nanus TaxID=290746 RepID=A0A914EQX2_9BILA